ncbi:GMC oxidoreductase-domain-containing protein [Pisolithus sp. B1]|nr:GMC oxidoreductase-domain-containing protein [Pisolithus sp. B1]
MAVRIHAGVPAKFDAWSRDGRKGWFYAELKPFFQRSETWLRRDRQEYPGHCGFAQVLSVDSYEGYYYKCFEAYMWPVCGAGPKKHLQEINVDVILDSPGTLDWPREYQDHLIVPTGYDCPVFDSLWAMIIRPTVLIRELYNYLQYRSGWFLGVLVELEIFFLSSLVEKDGRVKSIEGSARILSMPRTSQTLQFYLALSRTQAQRELTSGEGCSGFNPALLKVTLCGSLRMCSLDPRDAPEDQVAMCAGLQLSAEIVQQMCNARYPLKGTSILKSLEDADLDSFMQGRADSMYHYSSICCMTPLDDPLLGVVNNDFWVHSTTNLRIVNASISPAVPAVHPQALVYVVAEKYSDMIVKSHSLLGGWIMILLLLTCLVIIIPGYTQDQGGGCGNKHIVKAQHCNTFAL